MTIDIRLCREGEIGRVMKFIDKYWSKGHVLAMDRPLIDWQHRRSDGLYNYIVAAREGDEDLLGVLGFIPTSRYDSNLQAQETVWLALWKVRQDAASAGLGLSMLRYLTGLHPSASVGVVGIGPSEHIGMYRAFGFGTGQLTQYYMLNKKREDFRIAKIPSQAVERQLIGGKGSLTAIRNSDLSSVENLLAQVPAVIPRKSAKYFGTRFGAHPTYSYQLYLAEAPAGTGVLAVRRAVYEGSVALRLVDYCGPEETFAELGGALQRLIESAGAEYADIWNAGYSPDTFERAGLLRVDPEGDVIIPNYFEPFSQKNGRIAYALRSALPAPVVIFRADGDQDRPNIKAVSK